MKVGHSLLVLVLIAPAARAQCRVSSAPAGFADVDGNRAILSTVDGVLSPQRVHFYAKRADGWHVDQTSVIGTGGLLYIAPVAMDGDRAIAGAPETDVLRGNAYVFGRAGERWIPTQLQPVGVGPVDLFGASVDISGDIAVVGASHDAIDDGDGLGRVHVFEFDGAGWPQTAELLAYGDSIDIEGDTVAIGGNGHYLNQPVEIFRKVGGVWTWIAELRSPAPDGLDFGRSVALNGDRIAIGAPEWGPGPGILRIFQETVQGWWVDVDRIEPRQGASGGRFGASLAWSGTTLLVGAPAHSAAPGRVHRFEEIGGRFVESAGLTAGANGDGFGYGVARSGEDVVVVGYSEDSFFRLGIAEETPFCDQPLNTTGFPGRLSMEGCDSLSGRRLTLHASQLPPRTFARSFLGGELSPVPYGDGYRCVGNPLFRLSAANADAAGELRSAFDFDSPGGLELAPGSTWSFQVLYRDTRSPHAGFNLTNAVAVGITP